MKVAILADSNALPRGKGWGDLPWESTYPFQLDLLLRSQLTDTAPFIIERGMRYRTLPDVVRDWNEVVVLRQADYAIVQVGGADCAPRVLLPKEREWVKRWLPYPLSRRVLALEEKYRRAVLRRYPHRVCVPSQQFAAAADALLVKAQESKLRMLFLVNIFDPASSVLEQFAGAAEKIREYNAILKSHSTLSWIEYVDLHTMVRDLGGADRFTVDGLHLNAVAQKQLADYLGERILRDWRESKSLDENRHAVDRTGGDHLVHRQLAGTGPETVPLH